ncbi:peripheral-type benzodiazepine receptor-associated protein 1 [Crotalus adamanteus]|uniref:Peripheral-type benzodiazepine receptor-associated protein 1 n=1 Tax=Crotalus adamanteus TaxID=8729 RepID=A0AAW1CDN1_CROAD
MKKENNLLRKTCFPETQEKVRHLKRKNAELAVIAKRLEERARKLQEANLRVEGPPCLPLLDFQHLLQESQKEVLRLQRQIAMKNFKAALEPGGQGSGDISLAFAMNLGLNTSDPGSLDGQVWEFPLFTQGVLPRAAAWNFSLPRVELRIFLPLPDGKVVQPTGQSTGLELCQLGTVPGAEAEGAAGRLKSACFCTGRESELTKKRKQCELLEHEVKKKHKRFAELARVRELENQCRSHTEQFNFLSQELSRFRLQTGKLGLPSTSSFCSSLVTSEIVFATCQNSPQFSDGFKQKDPEIVPVSPRSSRKVQNEDVERFSPVAVRFMDPVVSPVARSPDTSSPPVASKKSITKLEAQSSSSRSESMHNSPKSCPTPEVDTASEMEELDTDSISLVPEQENHDPVKLQVFLARYSYNPFDGPNENPEAELPLTAGEYIYVYGEMDEDGFFEDAPLDVRVDPGPTSGILVISWLPVTIDAEGSSNGVRVTGYAVYADGQKQGEKRSDPGNRPLNLLTDHNRGSDLSDITEEEEEEDEREEEEEKSVPGRPGEMKRNPSEYCSRENGDKVTGSPRLLDSTSYQSPVQRSRRSARKSQEGTAPLGGTIEAPGKQNPSSEDPLRTMVAIFDYNPQENSPNSDTEWYPVDHLIYLPFLLSTWTVHCLRVSSCWHSQAMYLCMFVGRRDPFVQYGLLSGDVG